MSTRTTLCVRLRAAVTRAVTLSVLVVGSLIVQGCSTSVAPTGYISPTREARSSSQPSRSGAFEAAVARAQRQSRVVVVDFGAPWCGPCRMMERTTWSDPGVQRWLDAHAVRVHVDIEDRSDIKNRYRVGGVPTTIVLRNGRELGRTSGSLGPAQMIEWLRSTARAG